MSSDCIAGAGKRSLDSDDMLPDEIIVRILWHLDVPELLAVSRTSRRLRALALDPYLHTLRHRHSISSLSRLYPARPALTSIQPPTSTIYLSRTHMAARRLHWSLVRIRLNRSLSRRPAVASLVSANILPRECCRRDRASGEFVVAAAALSGGLVVERRRRVEREKVKEGLRVWLERKAGEIKRRRKKDGVGVGALVWRFTRRLQVKDGEAGRGEPIPDTPAGPRLLIEGGGDAGWEGRVRGLRNFWEGVGGVGAGGAAVAR